jgi:hypothetical protein
MLFSWRGRLLNIFIPMLITLHTPISTYKLNLCIVAQPWMSEYWVVWILFFIKKHRISNIYNEVTVRILNSPNILLQDTLLLTPLITLGFFFFFTLKTTIWAQVEWNFQNYSHGGNDPWGYFLYLHLHVGRIYERVLEWDH